MGVVQPSEVSVVDSTSMACFFLCAFFFFLLFLKSSQSFVNRRKLFNINRCICSYCKVKFSSKWMCFSGMVLAVIELWLVFSYRKAVRKPLLRRVF